MHAILDPIGLGILLGLAIRTLQWRRHAWRLTWPVSPLQNIEPPPPGIVTRAGPFRRK